jgi:Ca-activated chloride channel family protein
MLHDQGIETIMLTGDEISAPLTHITRATGGEVFNAVTPAALASVFQRIDEMKKVVVLEKRPQVIDFYEPFLMPALSLLGLSILALFGLRFTPW